MKQSLSSGFFASSGHIRWFSATVVTVACVVFGVSCITDAPLPPTERRAVVEAPPPDAAPPTERGTTRRPPPPPPDAAHLAPSKFSTLTLQYKTWKLPESLSKDKTLRVTVSGNDVWVGGVNGLFRLQNDKFEEITREKVVAMAIWHESDEKKDLVISHGNTLQIFDRGLVDSSLNGKLGTDPVVALYSRGPQELWLGTTSSLWQLKGDKLSQFEAIKGVKSIHSHPQSQDVVVTEQDGSIKILRQDSDGSWSMRALEQDGDKRFDQVTPASAGEFWGIANGLLYLRRKDETKGEAAWWPFIVQPGATPKSPGEIPEVDAAWHITRLLINPSDGFSWGVTKTMLLRLDGVEVQQLKMPSELKETSVYLKAEDGSLWLSDGVTLVRVGNEQKPPSYKDDIAPFMEKSCLRCHDEGGVAAHFLVTDYDKVKAGVDKMIFRVGNRSMPPPPAQLIGGDAVLLQRWKDTGFLP